MNRSETAILLGIAAAYDQRTVGEADVMAWQDLLADVRSADAVQAVKDHYAAEARRVMPVDVLTGVKRIRTKRLDENPILDVPNGMEAREYLTWLRETRKQIADGTLTTVAGQQGILDRAGAERFRTLTEGAFRVVPE